MRKNLFFLPIFIIFLLFATGCGEKPAPEENFLKNLSFTLYDFHGKEVKLSDFEGKNLVLNSWASWCVPCRQQLVDFAVMQRTYGDQIVFIAINRAEKFPIAKRFTDQVNITNEMVVLLDPEDSFYKSIESGELPGTIFINKQGKLSYVKSGQMDISELQERVANFVLNKEQ